ncbi:MAG: MFS transporter [Chloroflexia bacterium]|nr:MFS transporter [Chloroflexia bacterium]
MLHSLRAYPAFQLLLLGTLATNSAFWMYQVAVGWLALLMTNSPLFVGLTGFAGGIPLLIFSLPVGMVIDRFDRRRVLLVAQVGVMALAAVFALLVGTDSIAPWSILVLAIVYGTVMAFIFPTRTTIVTTLVTRDDLANAVALNAAGQNATRVIGPAVAGVLIALFGIATTFAVAALLQILALVATSRLPSRTTTGQPRGAMGWASLTLGLRTVGRDAFLVRLILLSLATNILVMPYINLMPVFARDELQVGSSGLGLLLASTGLGTVAGALWVAHSRRLGEWSGAHTVTAAAFALLILGFALTPNIPLAVLLLFAAGIVSAAFLALTQTALQMRVDDAVRGRVLSVYLLTWGMLPIGQLGVGAAADRIGPPWALAAACTLALAAIGIVARRKNPAHDGDPLGG